MDDPFCPGNGLTYSIGKRRRVRYRQGRSASNLKQEALWPNGTPKAQIATFHRSCLPQIVLGLKAIDTEYASAELIKP